ncbi:22.0 kDa heat shock protein-like [Musa acuminata AAA Group]|uniref:22.0 kDa heat shock protein-like n=1 Tax=Musa acuminata AAA Group TaxID=214697 RepID=UPI0031CFFF0F
MGLRGEKSNGGGEELLNSEKKTVDIEEKDWMLNGVAMYREGAASSESLVERSYGKFWRQFRLSNNVDLNFVSAKLEDGVLIVALPKLVSKKIRGPRVVSIAGGDDARDMEKLQWSNNEDKKVDL